MTARRFPPLVESQSFAKHSPPMCVYLSHTLMTSHAATMPSAPSAPTIYAKDKLTGFAPSRLHRCVLKDRILLRKPVLSLDTLFSRQVSHVADPKFVPDLGSTEALKASAIFVRYCHLSRFAPAGLACAFLLGCARGGRRSLSSIFTLNQNSGSRLFHKHDQWL